MKTLSKIMLLSLALPLVSCNEKVSSELKSSASSTSTTGGSSGGSSGGSGGSGGSTGQNNFTFEVNLTSPPQAGHKIHRTGYSFDGSSYTSRKTTPCKVSSPDNVPFSNDLFNNEADPLLALSHDDKKYDITCFVEVEELSLYLNGVDFQVTASPNACEIVSYSPFSYFSYMPGSSKTTYDYVRCPEGWAGPTASYPNPPGANMNCFQWRDASFSTNLAAIPQSDDELCRFDYTSEDGPNCDTGTVTIREQNYIDNPLSPGNLIRDPAQPTTIRTKKCGGKVAACVNGAIKKGTGFPATDTATSLISHTITTKDALYTKTFSLPALSKEAPDPGTNRAYVNYRKELANPKFDYDDYLNPSYANAFNPATNGFPSLYQTTFEPALMERYSQNRKVNVSTPTPYVLASDFTAFNTANNYTSLPFAAEAFMSTDSRYPVNPYYSFYCLNKSYENKARIRIVIREWDRLFADPALSTSTDFNYLSDIFLDGDSLQDNSAYDNYGEPFNDYGDWDDILHLVRSPGAFSDTLTDYEPVNGFFHQDNFPKDLYTGE